MEKRPLFSERNGRRRGFSNSDLVEQIWEQLRYWLYEQGILDEAFGYDINSWLEEDRKKDKNQHFDGILGNSRTFFTRALRYRVDFTYLNSTGGGLLSDRADRTGPPISWLNDKYKFLDSLELLHDIVSQPIRRDNAYKHIGFSKSAGQEAFREKVNPDLILCETPLTLLSSGQIVEAANKPVLALAVDVLDLRASSQVGAATIESLQNAVGSYMRRGAGLADKKQAVRELADVLESIRPRVKEKLLAADEAELFRVANGFAVRHNNSKQKGGYDRRIWYDWMFQVNLAAALTVIKIVQSQEARP